MRQYHLKKVTRKEKSLTPLRKELHLSQLQHKKKKKKTQHRKILAALTPDNEAAREASAQNFAEAYFQKVRSQLDDEKWSLFVQELVSFEEKSEGERRPADLYRKMADLLQPFPDLVDEFLGFLLPHQALEVDQVMAHLCLDKMSEFFRKLNILLMKRQVRQVYAALELLTGQQGVVLSEVKEAVLPLLKSSPLLTNLFLELLPGERPPDSLMTDFEQVDLKEDSECETIVVPDCPDPYGCENCICQCHMTQTRHCILCGIKYVNGRVYIQYGKALRPAKITFEDKKHLDLLKWEEEKCRNRRRLIPKTMLSPNALDHRHNADSEDDCGVKKSPRTPRIRVSRPKVCKKDQSESKEEEVLEGIFPLAETKSANNNTDELVESEKHNGIDEHDFDEIVLENECNTEEDDEEYLNKGLHSENESSIEAEDIAKELECSFEDEEADDIEDSEIYLSENLANIKDDNSGKTANVVPRELDCENTVISVSIKEEGLENKQPRDVTVDNCLSPTKKTSDIFDLKVEENAALLGSTDIVKTEILEPSDYSDNTDTKCIIKTEVEEIMDVCDEPSVEDTASSSEFPCGSGMNEVDNTSKEWTREEDKIILQTFQHENGLEQTFETASLQLPNRSKEEIQERFEILMKLLKEMISDESNSNP